MRSSLDEDFHNWSLKDDPLVTTALLQDGVQLGHGKATHLSVLELPLHSETFDTAESLS